MRIRGAHREIKVPKGIKEIRVFPARKEIRVTKGSKVNSDPKEIRATKAQERRASKGRTPAFREPKVHKALEVREEWTRMRFSGTLC